MPHDSNGTEVKIGHLVNVLCEVLDVQATHLYCNVTLRTHSEMPGNNDKTILSLNTKQVEVIPGQNAIK